MAQYLMAVLAQHSGDDLLARIGLEDPAMTGRMGDYVFNQEGKIIHMQVCLLISYTAVALDQIITQLMNESNAHRPVPASEDIVSKLPREIIAIKCMTYIMLEAAQACLHVFLAPTLEKECAICKEQFKLETEDPAEQIVITLPCTHPFHEPCILPWLKSSGTCPVCRSTVLSKIR